MADHLEPIDDLDPGALELLEAYRTETTREPAQVEAALSQVVAKAPVAPATSAAGGLSLLAKGLIAAVVLGTGLWVVSRPETPQPQATAPAPPEIAASAPVNSELAPAEAASRLSKDDAPSTTPTEPVDTAPAVPEHTESEVNDPAEVDPGPSATTRPAPPKRSKNRRETADAKSPASLAEQLRLLKQIRTDLRSGRFSAALEGIDEHRRQYPKSTFAEERDATEVTALCSLGRRDRARARAKEFSRRFPDSQRDVLAACDP